MSKPRGKLKDTMEAFHHARAILEECTDEGVCAKLWESQECELDTGIPMYAVTGPYICGVRFFDDLIPAVTCWVLQFHSIQTLITSEAKEVPEST
jgi:hypothetical protein